MKIVLDKVRQLDCCGVHNFSWGTLDTYFYLTASATRVEIFNDLIVIRNTPGGKKKAFDFSPDENPTAKFITINQEMPIYALTKKIGLKGSKFKEISYNLTAVFDGQSYPNARKRYKRIVAPLRAMANNRISIRNLNRADILAVKKLHDSWVKHKLNQPETFKIMFPKARYLRCADIATTQKGYLAFGAFFGDDLVGVRIFYYQENVAFDLAFFSDNSVGNWLAEGIAVYTMMELKRLGIEKLNCGSSLNEQLHAFKSHWPHERVISFAYPRAKVS